jgi:hypothetical protein
MSTYFTYTDIRMTTATLINTLQQKSYLCIPFLRIARPQSQFPHPCVCERLIYSQDRSTPHTVFLQQNIPGRGNIETALGIFVSNFRYWFFAVQKVVCSCRSCPVIIVLAFDFVLCCPAVLQFPVQATVPCL